MTILKAASAIICIATTAMVFAPEASAQAETGDYNKKTTVTFSGPVEIPGVHIKGYATLPAGTYVFKLVDSQVDRHIVQIQNADESKTYATIMAIPDMRLKPTDKTVITFDERPSGQPPPLRAWFYPGATWGDEFVYPKARAKTLAQANKTPVLYSENETSPEVAGPITPPTPPAVAKMNAAPVKAYNSAGNEEELSQAVTPPPPSNMQTSNTAPAKPAPTSSHPSTSSNAAPAKLPQTGSNLGLIMLSGLLALGCALGVQAVRLAVPLKSK